MRRSIARRRCAGFVGAVAVATLLGACGSQSVEEDGAARADAPDRRTSPVACGSSTYADGHQVIRYCGDGSAEVSIAGAAPVQVSGAACERHGAFVTANFGTNYSNPKAADASYVGFAITGVAVGGRSADGSLTDVAVTVDGKRIALSHTEATAVRADGSFDATVTGSTDRGDVEITATCPLT